MRTQSAPMNLTIRSTQSKGGRLHFEGVANAANVTDSYGTRFRWTDECLERSGDVQLLWNHNPDAALGRGTLSRDGEDLVLSGWVSDHAVTPYGVPVRNLLEDGTVRGLSVHFDAEARRERGQDFDTITPNYLPEVSLTTMPSNAASSVMSASVRAVLGELERHEDMQPLVGAIRSVLSETQRAWTPPRLKDFTDKGSWGELTKAEQDHIKTFFLYAPPDASTFGELKLPFKDPGTGKPNLDALKAAASRLPNTDIPETAKKEIGKKIAAEMSKLGSEYTGQYAPKRSLALNVVTRSGGPLSYDLLEARLQYAVKDAYQGYDPWNQPRPVAIHDDFCVLYDPTEAAFYKHMYSVDENGIVTLDATATPVLMEWRPVSANAEGEPEPPEAQQAPRGITKDDIIARLRGGNTIEESEDRSGELPIAEIFRRALNV